MAKLLTLLKLIDYEADSLIQYQITSVGVAFPFDMEVVSDMLDDAGDEDVVAEQHCDSVVADEEQPHPLAEQATVHLHVVAPVVYYDQFQQQQECARRVVEVVVLVKLLLEPLLHDAADLGLGHQSPEQGVPQEPKYQRDHVQHRHLVHQHRQEPDHLLPHLAVGLLPEDQPDGPDHPADHDQLKQAQLIAREKGDHTYDQEDDRDRQLDQLGRLVLPKGLDPDTILYQEQQIDAGENLLEEVKLVAVPDDVEDELEETGRADYPLVQVGLEEELAGGGRRPGPDLGHFAIDVEVANLALDALNPLQQTLLVGLEEDGDQQVRQEHEVAHQKQHEKQNRESIAAVEGQGHVGEVAGRLEHHQLVGPVQERGEGVLAVVLEEQQSQRAEEQQVPQQQSQQPLADPEYLAVNEQGASDSSAVNGDDDRADEHVEGQVSATQPEDKGVGQECGSAEQQQGQPCRVGLSLLGVVEFKYFVKCQKRYKGEV